VFSAVSLFFFSSLSSSLAASGADKGKEIITFSGEFCVCDKIFLEIVKNSRYSVQGVEILNEFDVLGEVEKT
jgi:hypothetical protein